MPVAPKAKVKVIGKSSSRKAMKTLSKETITRFKQLIRENSIKVWAGAWQNAPVRTSALRRSLKVRILRGGLTGEIGTDKFYASFQEFGTKKHRKQPFLFPAFRKVKRHMKRADIQRVMDKVAARARAVGNRIS